MSITIRLIAEEERQIPEKKSDRSAGYDLKAYLGKPKTIGPGERTLISTGIRLEIPPGYEGQVRPRSGLAIKHGITVLNSPGTIDSDYRGDVGVILYNTGDKEFTVHPGDRIAQIIFSPVHGVDFSVVSRLQSTSRGDGGFGSTGT